jgi:hypothetical protein
MPAPVTSWLDHKELRSASWLAGSSYAPSAALLRYLFAFLAGGIAAACVTLLELKLRLPGHAIAKAALPVALGLAVSPQRFTGLIISGGAYTGLSILKQRFGVSSGQAATTSLLLLGPLLDLFLWQARRGWSLYAAFAAAGLVANCLAFAVRFRGKTLGLDGFSMRPLSDWLTTAPWTYAIFGLAAGLISGLILFRTRSRGTTANSPPQP